jgi:predicted nucleic acid-binding protein
MDGRSAVLARDTLYLPALAIGMRSYLVTGDQDLLGLKADLPILTAAEFLTKLRQGG